MIAFKGCKSSRLLQKECGWDTVYAHKFEIVELNQVEHLLMFQQRSNTNILYQYAETYPLSHLPYLIRKYAYIDK